MIKIIFEISKDLIANNASDETVKAKMDAAEGNKALKVLFDMIGFKQVQKQIEKGKTEFIVTPDKLKESTLDLYNKELGTICMLAECSETDKEPQDAE